MHRQQHRIRMQDCSNRSLLRVELTVLKECESKKFLSTSCNTNIESVLIAPINISVSKKIFLQTQLNIFVVNKFGENERKILRSGTPLRLLRSLSNPLLRQFQNYRASLWQGEARVEFGIPWCITESGWPAPTRAGRVCCIH